MDLATARHRVWSALAAIVRRVQAIPRLGTMLALLAAAVWVVLTIRDAVALAADERLGDQVAFAIEPDARRTVQFEFFEQHWKRGALLALPALLVSLVRLRGKDWILPVALVSGGLAVWWTAADLHENLDKTINDPLGMDPSPAAYFVKLALMVGLFLSPPVLMAMYYRSSIMDRYLVRTFAAPFLLCLCAITGIMITMNLLDNANDFAEAKFGFGKVLKFYLIMLPKILVTITEAALLLATLYSLGRMSRYNELISMQGAGRSVLRVLAPVLVFGGWCALAVGAMNYQLAPESDRKQEQMRQDSLVKAKDGTRDSGVEYAVAYRNRADFRTWFIQQLPYDLNERNKMEELWVFQQDEDENPVWMMVARRAVWNPYDHTWTFYEAVVLTFLSDGQVTKRLEDKIQMTEAWPETPGGIVSDRLNPEYLGVPELIGYLRTNEGRLPERTLAPYQATMHWRFALPFRCFLLVLLAAPLGIVSSRRGLLGGVATAVGLFMAVYFLSSVVLKAGEGLYLSPAVGAWAVNAVFLVAGMFLLWKRSGNHTGRRLNPLNWFSRAKV